MRVIGVQYDIAWENRAANFAKVRQLLEGAEIPERSLIVLPEMFATGFSMHVDKIADGDPPEAESFVRNLASESGCAVLGGVVTPGVQPGFGKNELTVAGPDGSEIARYQKNRTFRYTKEFDHYERGTEVVVFDWGEFRICPLICYDLRFPELFRRGAAHGTQLFIVIASWPAVRVEHWITLLRARAIENQAYVFAVNRSGQDPNFEYPGRSIAVDPHGEIIADAGEGEGLLDAELDLRVVEDWRTKFQALADLEV